MQELAASAVAVVELGLQWAQCVGWGCTFVPRWLGLQQVDVFLDELAGFVADELGVDGLHGCMAHHYIAQHGVFGDAHDLPGGVHVQRLAGAVDAGFLGKAVGRVVLELVGLAVFVDEDRQAVGSVVAELDAAGAAGHGFDAACELASGAVVVAGGAAQGVVLEAGDLAGFSGLPKMACRGDLDQLVLFVPLEVLQGVFGDALLDQTPPAVGRGRLCQQAARWSALVVFETLLNAVTSAGLTCSGMWLSNGSTVDREHGGKEPQQEADCLSAKHQDVSRFRFEPSQSPPTVVVQHRLLVVVDVGLETKQQWADVGRGISQRTVPGHQAKHHTNTDHKCQVGQGFFPHAFDDVINRPGDDCPPVDHYAESLSR